MWIRGGLLYFFREINLMTMWIIKKESRHEDQLKNIMVIHMRSKDLKECSNGAYGEVVRPLGTWRLLDYGEEKG